jgi:ferredoxin
MSALTRKKDMPRVSLADSDKVFEVNEGEIIYDSLYDRGHELPHGCLAGSCGACRVEIVEGSNNLQPAGVIESNTVEAVKEEFIARMGQEFLQGKIVRLACRAKIKGDVTIRPLKIK